MNLRTFVTGIAWSLALLGGAPAVQALAIHDIPAGDAATLHARIEAALQSSEPSVIRLAPKALYNLGRPLIPEAFAPTVASDLQIQGQGARVVLTSTDQKLITVDAEDVLRLSDLQLSIRFAGPEVDMPRILFAISVIGASQWENVTLSNSVLRGFFPPTLIFVRGNQETAMQLTNVSIVGNRLSNPISLIASGTLIATNTIAGMRITSSTIADNRGHGIDSSIERVASIVDGGAATLAIGNSIVDACGDEVSGLTSLGGNVFADPSCPPGPQDRLVADLRLTAYGDHGGLVPTVGLLPDSPAVGAGLAANCPAVDARGYLRDAACDAGAYEFGAGSAAGQLSQGGVNGTWYDPSGRGVLLINRNSERDTLLVWLSYDSQLRQKWIYAVLPFAADSVSGSAYANEAAPTAGQAFPAAAPVGSFNVQFHSCQRLSFRFDSSSPGIDSVNLELQRLSLVTQLGCVD